MPVLLPLEEFQESDLRYTLEAGGFKGTDYDTKNCYLEVPDVRR